MQLATVPLAAHHDRAGFACGNPRLDAYLHRQAGQDTRRDVTNAFVYEGDPRSIVLGYYTLSMTGIEYTSLPERLTGKLPRYELLPGALLGRLAVSRSAQGQGVGTLLLLDAVRRIAQASSDIAAFAVVVDAIDDRAATFYRGFQFEPLHDEPDRLILPLALARKYI